MRMSSDSDRMPAPPDYFAGSDVEAFPGGIGGHRHEEDLAIDEVQAQLPQSLAARARITVRFLQELLSHLDMLAAETHNDVRPDIQLGGIGVHLDADRPGPRRQLLRVNRGARGARAHRRSVGRRRSGRRSTAASLRRVGPA